MYYAVPEHGITPSMSLFVAQLMLFASVISVAMPIFRFAFQFAFAIVVRELGLYEA